MRSKTLVCSFGESSVAWRVLESGIRASGPDTRLPCPSLFVTDDCLVSFVTERTQGKGASGRIVAWSADLGGSNWRSGETIIEFPDDGENNDFGYPWIVPLDDDSWWCAFYHGKRRGACSIYGLTLEPEVLLK